MRDDDERLRQAIRVGNIGIFDHDHETGVIFCSAELREIYGWNEEEPLTLPKILWHVNLAVADPGGTLTFANAALSRLWGYCDRDVLRGRSLFDLWKTSDAPAAALERIRDERIRTVEQPAQRVDGSPFHVAITAEAVCDA